MRRQLGQMLLQSAEKFSGRKCVGNSTYNDMYQLTKRYSDILNIHGIGKKSRVCWEGEKSVHWLSAMTAVWSLGAIFVPLQRGNNVLNDHIVKTIQPDIVLSPLYVENVAAQKDMVLPFQGGEEEEDEVAMVLFTSGSTSTPKGVVLTHENISSNLDQIQERVANDIGPEDSSYSILPWHHCYGLVCELLFLTKNGAQIHIPSSQNPKQIMADMKWWSPTLFYAVPKVVETMLRNDKKVPAFVKRNFVFGRNIRRMSLGGAPCHPRLIHFMEDSYGVSALQGYGMTETSPMISLNSMEFNRIGSVGKPLQGVDVQILEENQEVCVRGPNRMAGYLERVGEEGLVLEEQGEWLHTGDKGHVDEEGYLHIHGRTKIEYKLSNGKYVNPVFIESILCMQPAIDQAVVFGEGLSHNKVILHSTKQQPDMGDLLQLVRTSLEGKVQPYEIPREILLVEEPFTLQNGQLTQKLEPNRRRILEIYAH